MSQAAAQQPSRKKTVLSLLVLLALTCIIVFIFKDHWAEITTALAQRLPGRCWVLRYRAVAPSKPKEASQTARSAPSRRAAAK